MSGLKYFVWLSTKIGLSKAAICRAIQQLGTPENIYNADDRTIDMIQGIGRGSKERMKDKSLSVAAEVIEECMEKNIGIITLSDASYPERLRNISTPPAVLYTKGKFCEIDGEMAVSFVGHRYASPKTLKYVSELAKDFATAGGLVISGMAKGIDGAAHRGAMAAGKPTVAVLGCGIDYCYPCENRDIYDYASKYGTIISEYPPGTTPARYYFPERNRIISGLSLGVLVAEAPTKSGSLITAKYATEQSRDLFVVPGNPADSNCSGSNALLKDGAKPVMNAMDIIEEYIGIYPDVLLNREGCCRDIFRMPEQGYKCSGAVNDCLPDKGNSHGNANETGCRNKNDSGTNAHAVIDISGLDEEEIAIVNAIGGNSTHIDTIINKTGLSAEKVLSALTTLEIKGVISQLPGKFFVMV